MAWEDVLMIRGKEVKRLHVLKQVIERRLTQREAGGAPWADGSADSQASETAH